MNDLPSWLAGGGVTAFFLVASAVLWRCHPAIISLLEARAASRRADADSVARRHVEIEDGLQRTVDHLRTQIIAERDRCDARLDVLEKQVRDLLDGKARLQQELEDLKGKR